MLDATHLRTLHAVARSGSFASAAKALSLTPSAVSQQMATLERACGTGLFEREARGTRLTHAGERLLVHAESVLAQLSDAERELAAIAGGRGGLLRFGSFPTATAAFGAAAMQLFRSRYPSIATQYADGEPYESLRRLAARELDLALVFELDSWPIGSAYDGSLVGLDDECEYVRLFDDPFFLVTSRGHRLAGTGVVRLEELAGEPMLGGPPWEPELRRLCEAAGFEPRFDASCETPDFWSLQALVSAGLGLTVIPALALTSLRADVAVQRLEPAPVRHVSVAIPRHAYRSPAVAAMLDIVRSTSVDLPSRLSGFVDAAAGEDAVPVGR